MASKFFVLALVVAAVSGSAIHGADHSSFSYGVSDPHTGDVKDQHEKRVGDSVVGKYSLIESDGSKRIVEYEANPVSGFNAVVRKEPGLYAGHHGYAGALVAAPLATLAPLAHAPIAHSSYSSPLAYSGAYNSPLAYASAPLAHGGLSSYAAGSPLGYGGYGSPLASSLGYGARVPTVSHYANKIVHPYGYGSGYAGYGNGSPLVHGALTYGAYAGHGLGYGSQQVW